jgi:hypothetical protein
VSSGKLRREVEALKARRGPEDERRKRREEERERIRGQAEHANHCARGGWRPFEITEGGDVLCAVDGKPVTDSRQTLAEQTYWTQMEWEALELVRGLEPTLTLDGAGAFVTLDDRFALGRERQDIRAHMGPETMRQQEAVPLERWGEFLDADAEAAALLEGLLALAEDADVPDAFKTPLHEMHELGEINDGLGKHDLGSIFEDGEERGRVRRMTWALMHDPGARRMLSELTLRRDAFAAENPSG